MKTLIASLVLIMSVSAFAATETEKGEAIRVANVILDNPEAVAEVKAEGANIVDYTVNDKSNGVNTYKFKLNRTCFCIPKPGTLTIVQDLRPSFADGPIKYSYELVWDKQ